VVGPDTFLLALLTSLVVTSVVGLTLLSAGRFFAPWLMGAQGSVTAALLLSIVLTQRSGLRWRSPRGKVALLAGAALLVVAVLLRVPPSFYTDGGQDQGSYVNTAAHYVREGRLLIHDALLSRAYSGNTQERSALQPLFPLGIRPGQPVIPGRYEGTRLPGYYIGDAAPGTVVPQFYPLHPLWMALLWLMLGPPASVYALTVFSVLALVAVYYLCMELFGRPWEGIAALALLAVNILQVWVNRYPVSETMAQFWLVTGLWLHLRWRRTGSAGELWLSASCLGLYAFTRFSAIALVPVYAAAFLLDRGGRQKYLFYNLALGLNVVALAHATAFTFPYLHDLLFLTHRVVLLWSWWHMLGAGALALVGLNLIKKAGQSRVWNPLAEWAVGHRKHVLAAACVLAVGAVLARTINLTPAEAWAVLSGRDPTVRIVQMSWYLTKPGLIAALVGVWVMLTRHGDRRRDLLWAGAVVISLLFQFVVQFRNGYQFYYGRYYVSEALPFLVIGLGGLVIALLRTRRLPARAVGAAAAAGLAVVWLLPYTSNPAFRVRELDDAYADLGQIAERLPADSVTFVGSDGSVEGPGFPVAVGTGLMFIMGRYTLPGSNLRSTFAAARCLIREGKQVYLLWASTTSLGDVTAFGLNCVPVASGLRSVTHSERVLAVPRKVTVVQVPWVLYHLRPRRATDPIVVRYNSQINRIAGAWVHPGYAWTNGHARITGIETPPGVPLVLTITLSHLFPGGLNPRVQVLVNGSVVFSARRMSGESLHARAQIGPITIPPRLNRPPLTVELISDTFVPAETAANSTDTRRLSLDLVELRFQPRLSAGRTAARVGARPQGAGPGRPADWRAGWRSTFRAPGRLRTLGATQPAATAAVRGALSDPSA
jgi:4-amino-4-deoxy-L-arabinose transferase-like glycosyltransferase